LAVGVSSRAGGAHILRGALIAAAVLWAGSAPARADDQQEYKAVGIAQTQTDTESSAAEPADPADLSAPAGSSISPVTIETIELSDKKDKTKVVTWLGLAVEESSEALSAQLGLKSGEGLTVTMIAADSPAAKAEFHKNDVLVELDGQMLVHPMQLRKLVQMHAEGDTVQLSFYRAGKKQTISVKLGKTTWAESSETINPGFPGFQQNFHFGLKDLDGQLRSLPGQLAGVSQSLAWAGLDKSKMNTEIKRTMEQTRKAIQDAVRHASSDQKSLAGVDRQLEALTRDGVDVDKDATVIIRNKHNSNKVMVQTDDSGSYIIEAAEKTHLTARDKDGKLLFEGEIDTAAEREKVPKEVWEKVGPMFKQINAPEDGKPKAERKIKQKYELLKQKV
jgi:hypothetical protein